MFRVVKSSSSSSLSIRYNRTEYEIRIQFLKGLPDLKIAIFLYYIQTNTFNHALLIDFRTILRRDS